MTALKAWLMAIVFGVVLIFLPGIIWAADVTVSWNEVPTATSYKLYYGIESGSLDQVEDMGTASPFDFVMPEGFYYFAATASNQYGESGKSEEVPALILPAPKITIGISYTIPIQ